MASTASPSSSTRPGTGILDVFYLNSANQVVLRNSYNGLEQPEQNLGAPPIPGGVKAGSRVGSVSWSAAWEALGGVLTKSPTATSKGPGTLDVYVADLDHHIQYRSYRTAAGWSGYQLVQDDTVNVVTDPSAAIVPGFLGALEIVAGVATPTGTRTAWFRSGHWTVHDRAGDPFETSAPVLNFNVFPASDPRCEATWAYRDQSGQIRWEQGCTLMTLQREPVPQLSGSSTDFTVSTHVWGRLFFVRGTDNALWVYMIPDN